MSRLIHEVDGKVYLDRQIRQRAMLDEIHAGQGVNIADWVRRETALLNEVVLDLVPGNRYRWRFVKVEPEIHHHHYRADDGSAQPIDLWDAGEGTYVEATGIYLGRVEGTPGTPGNIAFLPDRPGMFNGSETIGMADIDILRIEEIDDVVGDVVEWSEPRLVDGERRPT